MRTFWLAAAIGVAFGLAPVTTARAEDIITYNFNTGDPQGWYSPPDQWQLTEIGGNEKSWKLLLTGSNPSANYLYSPCLIVTDTTKFSVDLTQHRFKFGVTGTSGTGLTYVPPAGQVQYSTDGGATWNGIPIGNWSSSGQSVPPTLDPASLAPTTTALLTSGYAFQGTSLNYSSGNFIQSSFTLNGLTYGGEIQFRLLGDFGGTTPTADLANPPWDLDSFQIKGVVECPEPGALVLAGIGGLGCLLVVRRRRKLAARAVPRSAAGLIATAVLAGVCSSAAPSARADAIWNFQLTSGSWTKSMVGPWTPPANQWVYTGTMALPLPPAITGGTSPHWHITGQGVTTTTRSAYYLTSPTISGIVDTGTGAAPATQARISIAHNYLLKMGVNGTPIETGLLEYQLNGSGTWVGLPLSAFTNGSSVLIDDPLFGASPFKPLIPGDPLRFVNQTAYVAATYLTPTGTAALPYVAPGAAAFTGTTNGWSNSYVPSQAFLNGSTGLPAPGISTLQLRFVNANLASGCDGTEGWNIRYVEVNFLNDEPIPPVPEPAALALGGTAFASLAVAAALRRLTTGPRGRA